MMTETFEKIPVSVVIPVKNEEVNLSRSLSQLGRFSEIIVVDSSSTDRTPEIVRASGARYVNFKWDGGYPKKRNWLLMNHSLANSWVLFLDADEFVDDRFCDALAAAVKRRDVDAYWLSYTNWFLGRRLEHGVPQLKLALFRVGTGFYERIDEERWSRLDMEIHEHPIISGSIGVIAARIDHRDDRGIIKFVDRHRDYALWEARRAALLASEKDGWEKLTSRQRFKYGHISKWWFPLFYFVFQYIIKQGVRDGAAGFYYAFYKAWYFETVRLTIRDFSTSSEIEH